MHDAELLKGAVKGEASPAAGLPARPRPPRRTAGRSETDSRIRQILWDHPRGLTVGEVARALSLGRGAAGRRLDALARNGEIELSTFGQTRVFTLPRRGSLDSTLSQPSSLVISLSPTLRVLDVNDAFLGVFRLAREDVVGRPLGKTPFAMCGGRGLLEALREGTEGVPVLTEFECIIGDSHRVFRARITPFSPSRGRRGVVVSLEDVTGMALYRRRLERFMDEGTLGLLSSHPGLLEEILERRHREEQMEAIQFSVDRDAVAALWIGRDGHLLRANRAAARLLGYREEELARLTYSDLDPDHPPGSWDSVWEVFRARSATSLESRFRTKAGDTIPVDLRASHLVYRDQEFILLHAEDITARKGKEEARRASDEALRAFLDASLDPSFLVDTAGRVLFANRAGLDLLGMNRAGLAGTSLLEAIPDRAEAVGEALRGVLETHRPEVLDGEISGRYFHTILSPVPDGDGEVRKVAVFARDFTERKRMEDALRDANRKLNLLTAVTRHDVLNDIGALTMYLSLPEMQDGEEPGSGIPGKLGPLITSLRRKMEFTRDYADLGMKMPGWEDLAAAVAKGIAGMDTAPVRIDLDLGSLEVYADPLLDRVISNLVDNTLRHGEHATFIRFGARPEGDACVLSVEDDGAGIAPGMKEVIFRPGYGRHTGLGLFLVREILGITGMTIRETGEEGKGARFEIRIPPGGFRIRDGSGGGYGVTGVRA
jgi:PAS domain S-box-containing protein